MDLSNKKAVAKLLLPKVPMILKTAAFHTLSLSSTSSKWDLKTEVTLNVLRSLLTGPPQPVSKTQKFSLRDPGVKGKIWVSRIVVPTPGEDEIRDALFRSIDELKEGDEVYAKPDLVPVEAEWTGFRNNATTDSPEMDVPESEKYGNMMKEVSSDLTILYVHGGAYYLMDPASHRPLTVKLAELTGGRVLSVRYRLAPQHPFPSALLDAFLSYLYLLYPPHGSLHKPVEAKNIVFAGDSAGGNLALALLQLILQLHRSSPSGETPAITFNGQKVQIPLPGGVSVASPWCDITSCMPSLHTNAQYDYLPSPSARESFNYPADAIWPSTPPRPDMYCEGSAMCHPLVSPLAAMNWRYSPPVFMNMGQELLADEGKVLVRRMSSQGVRVVWDEYEAMPHVFAMVLEGSAVYHMSFEQWAEFLKDVVERPNEIASVGHFSTAKRLERREVKLEGLIEMSDEDVSKRMREARDKRIEAFEKRQVTSPVPKL